MSAPNESGGTATISVEESGRRQTGEPLSLLVDVREMDEYVELRVEGSVFMPMSQLGGRFSELPQDQPLMLICLSGERSARATAFLTQQGFSDVSNVEGGMMAWKHADLPTRAGPLDAGEGDL